MLCFKNTPDCLTSEMRYLASNQFRENPILLLDNLQTARNKWKKMKTNITRWLNMLPYF